MATVTDVRRIARQAAEASQAGQHTIAIGTQTFNLREGGMCLRFVRQCEESAAGQQPHDWRFDSRYAIWADHAMRKAGLEVADREQADVVCFNKGKGINHTPGHIGIYLGKGLVAENSSAGNRGNPRRPGTKLTPLVEIGLSRAQFFQTVPMTTQPSLTVTVDGTKADIGAWIDKGITYAHLRRTVEAMGGNIGYDGPSNTIAIRTVTP